MNNKTSLFNNKKIILINELIILLQEIKEYIVFLSNFSYLFLFVFFYFCMTEILFLLFKCSSISLSSFIHNILLLSMMLVSTLRVALPGPSERLLRDAFWVAGETGQESGAESGIRDFPGFGLTGVHICAHGIPRFPPRIPRIPRIP